MIEIKLLDCDLILRI